MKVSHTVKIVLGWELTKRDTMRKISVAAVLGAAILGASAFAQSPLDGTTFQASTYNLHSENVGTVRLIDVPDTECGVEDGPLGNDKPGEECFVLDSGVPAVDLTFGGGAQQVGDVTVTPTATPFEGLEAPIEIFNFITDTTAPTTAFNNVGDLLEFAIVTEDRALFPSADDEDFWGFSATGIQYPNAAAESFIGLPFDEELGNFTNFYFWYEDKDGPITDGYEVGLPVGLGVGRHPIDADREVLYPLYSRGQTDEQTDTVVGGSLDFYSHGSILDSNPLIGNILVLADNTLAEIDALEEVVGFGLGVFVQRPDTDEPLCDPNTMGDIDGDGTVAFGDFLILSANFGQTVDSHSLGDIDCSGDVAFADFLLLSANFGQSVGAQSVPEPNGWALVMLAAVGCLALRRQTLVG